MVSGPVGMCLTRQAVPTLEGTTAEGVAKGGYVLADAEGDLQVILLASGSEVQIAVAGPRNVAGRGHRHPGGVRAVPGLVRGAGRGVHRDRCCRRGDRPGVDRGRDRAAVVALARRAGRPVSLEHYGASADAKTLFTEFGITPEPPWPTPRNPSPPPEAAAA